MRINEFISSISEADNVEEAIREHITKDYINYISKANICERIAKASCYKKVNDRTVFWINSPAQYMLLVMEVIYQYTDLERGDNIIDEFDVLDAAGLVDVIISLLPDREYETIRSLLAMIVEDIRENERSFAGYLDGKIDVMNDILSAIDEDVINNV